MNPSNRTSERFKNIAHKLKAMDFQLAKEEIIKNMLEMGIVFDKFEVIKLTGRSHVSEAQRLAIVSTYEPMPKKFYAPLMKVFNELYPDNYRARIVTFPVRLVSETLRINYFELSKLDNNSSNLSLLANVLQHANFLCEELTSWQACNQNEAIFTCTPGYDNSSTSPCIFVTVSDLVRYPDDSIDEDCDGSEELRDRVRLVPEYHS